MEFIERLLVMSCIAVLVGMAASILFGQHKSLRYEITTTDCQTIHADVCGYDDQWLECLDIDTGTTTKIPLAHVVTIVDRGEP